MFRNIILLSGGDSTRFWPLEHKTITSFLGKPLIAYLVEKLQKYTDNLFIVTNKKDITLFKKINLDSQLVVQENLSLGQGGAILSLEKIVDGEALIVNASDFLDFEIIEKIAKVVKEKHPELAIVAKTFDDYFPGGYLKFKNQRLIGIVEKPEENSLPSRKVKLVLDYTSSFSSLIKNIKKIRTSADDLYEKGLNSIIKSCKAIEVIDYSGYLFPLKYPWQILSLSNHFLKNIKSNKIDKTVKISPKAEIISPVIIEKNVIIGDYAKIAGPCYIGKNTVVSDYSLVRNSHINSDCIVGSYSEVARSYLNNRVMLHRNYVGDSILDENVLMGAGTITANFRFDEKNIGSKVKKKKINTNKKKLGAIIGRNSKIGINVSILPGIKIGEKTIIAPGERVDSDVEEKKFLFGGKKKENLISFKG